MPRDEKQLIADLKNDSQRALAEIYDHYAPRLYAFGMKYYKVSTNVEELVEDTFVWLWNNRHDIRNENSIKAIMFIRMRHYLINNYRAIVNSPEYESYVGYVERLGTADTDKLEYEDFLKQLHHAISQLPETQQQIIKMSKIEQMSNQKIASALNLKEQTVRNQLSSALKNLKKILGPLYIVCSILFYVN
uniref:RNA polymerase sigma-70 factor n=1 Tax=Prevotella sp. GTC17254 TaxID=3236794 RepID=A0AB33J3Z4_9BACT